MDAVSRWSARVRWPRRGLPDPSLGRQRPIIHLDRGGDFRYFFVRQSHDGRNGARVCRVTWWIGDTGRMFEVWT